MAKFKNCAALPQPTPGQSVTYGTNKFGCFYKLKTHFHATGTKSRAQWWQRYTVLSVADLNRRLTRGIAKYWKEQLTTTDRDNWSDAALDASWKNYDGSNAASTGFNLWVAVQRFARYSGFDPTQQGANIFTPTELVHGYSFEFPLTTIPSPWAPPDPPNIQNPLIFDGNYLYFEITNDPSPGDTSMTFGQARNFKITNRNPKSYIAASGSYPDQLDPIPNGHCDFDYPSPEFSSVPNVRIGLRFFDYATALFSNPSWVLISS